MQLFMELFGKVMEFLPNSFLLSALVTYNAELQPFYEVLGYANYFIPFSILVNIFSGWVLAMLTAVLGYKFYRKL